MATKTRRKRCTECDNFFPPDDLDRGCCESCLEYREWCEVCKCYQSTEGGECRHIHWTDCGWVGAGTYEGGWDDCKEWFWALLDVLAGVDPVKAWLDGYPDIVTAIEAEIRKDAFFTRLEGFMMSTPTLYLYRLRPDLPHRNEDGSPYSLFFARIDADQIERDDGDVADGFGWLQSLWATDTPEANRRTVRWIKEWRKRVAGE
jgi:hypothetical protein